MDILNMQIKPGFAVECLSTDVTSITILTFKQIVKNEVADTKVDKLNGNINQCLPV